MGAQRPADGNGTAQSAAGGEMGRERRSAKRPAFRKPWRCRPPCAQRQANGNAKGVPWVRAQGAHCNTACARANGKALAWQMVRVNTVLPCAPCARTKGRAMALPIGILASKAPRHWITEGHAIGPCARCFAVRAPKEEQWPCPPTSPAPKPPRHWIAEGHAIGPCARCFAVRAPKEWQ